MALDGSGGLLLLFGADAATAAAAGTMTIADAIAAGATVSDLIAAGTAIPDLIAGGVTVSDLLAGGAAVSDLLSAGVTTIPDLISSGALTNLGSGTLLDSATGAILDATTGSEFTTLGEEGIKDASQILGTHVDNVGNLVQTFDDGSTITTDATGNVINTTEATADPVNLKDALGNPIVKAVGSSLAKTAFNSLLSGATNALMGKSGFKPVGQGGLSSSGQQNTTMPTGMELTPGLTSTNPNYSLDVVSKVNPELYSAPTNPALNIPQMQAQPQTFAAGGYAMGGEYQEHNPSFYSEGGMENRYVEGDGDGTSDDVAAMLANGEFVIPADVVADLGNGSNDAGAKVLDQFLAAVREDKHSNNPDELPPNSKGPLAYLAQAQKKA
jgi:hypothetical protein